MLLGRFFPFCGFAGRRPTHQEISQSLCSTSAGGLGVFVSWSTHRSVISSVWAQLYRCP